MSNYGSNKKNMDLLYLLLPIIGAFVLLFLVCCFGKKVKEMLHIPKELVLGRNFPGLASSTSSSTSSSRSSLSGNDADDSDDEVTAGEPSIVINMNTERQRVMAQHHHRRRYYAQVPSDEMVFCLQSTDDITAVDYHAEHQLTPPPPHHHQHHLYGHHLHQHHHHQGHRSTSRVGGGGSLATKCRLSVWNNYQVIHRKTKNRQRRADSCPLLTDTPTHQGSEDSCVMTKSPVTSYVNVIHSPYHSRLHPGYWQARYYTGCDVISADLDSDSSDIPATSPHVVLEKPDRRRHRSNSESDLPPKRCSEYETESYLLNFDPRLNRFSHKLSSTEFQLHHAPQDDCAATNVQTSDVDERSLSQAEVG